MRLVLKCLGLCFVLVALLGVRPAVADTYDIYGLAPDNARVPAGMTLNGAASILVFSCAETQQDPCYRTYDHGVQVGVSATLPMAATNDSSVCAIWVGGFQGTGVCNGGYEAFSIRTGDAAASLLQPGIYAGPADDPTLVLAGGESALLRTILNANGDVLFDDVHTEEIYQAYDTTPTPEPGTWALLATGLGFGLVMQRRLVG